MSNYQNNTVSAPLLGSTITGTVTYPTLGSYTVSAANFADTAITNNIKSAALSVDGELELTGEKADVVINGVSLTDSLKAIEQRLNILRVNNELEAEWDQLRELGEQYRRLEADIVAKQRMWETLQK